nr:BTAD domain-containing putative transcriptional regulator [Kibdelosporangium phytohabitans]
MFRTMGVLEVTDSAEVVALSAEKPRRLLLLLLLRANRWVPDAELTDAVWPDGAPASAAGNIKSYVSQLRGVLGPADGANRIDRQPGAYRLNARRDEIDAILFEDLVDRGRTAQDPGHTVKLLTDALDLWRGTPYEQLDVHQAKPEVTRLTELRWAARHMLADALIDIGDRSAAIALLRAMTVDDPLREQTWHSLMTVLHSSGRRAEALAAYQEVRRALVDDLGIEPGAELRDVHEKVLRDDVAPVHTAPPAPVEPVVRRPGRQWAIAALALVLVLLAYVVATEATPPDSAPSDSTAVSHIGHSWGQPSTELAGDRITSGWVVNGPWPSHAGGHYVPGNVTTRDGNVVISGSPNGDTGHLWQTDDAVSGRVEARVRIPPGCACHRPAFSLWSVTEEQRAGEIVFLEAPGGDRQTARFAIHHPGRGSQTETKRVDLTWWNIVAVEWAPDHVTGFLNGERWFHAQRGPGDKAVALRPTFKIDWLGGTRPSSSTVEVDWIRVYDR